VYARTHNTHTQKRAPASFAWLAESSCLVFVCFSSSAQLTGTLTLNGEGLADPLFVFQIGSALTTATGSSVVTENDGGSLTPGISVYWQVGSSATLGTTTAFEGNILALTSITADTGASVEGRLLAETGTVTLDNNTISELSGKTVSGVPDMGDTLLLLGLGIASLVTFGRRVAFPVSA